MIPGLVTTPRWIPAVLGGIGAGGLVYAFLPAVAPGPAAPRVLVGVATGVILGLLAGSLTAEATRRAAAVAELDTPDELKKALRAARSGPAPADPRIGAAAHRLVTWQRHRAEEDRAAAGWTVVPGFAFSVVLALLATPWLLLFSAGFVVLLVRARRRPAQLARRAEALSQSRSEHQQQDRGQHRGPDQADGQ
ncbi:hypothetical protein [Kineosporia succinea]|uniref:Uncharacterized protein n=1 Tax=Kineosporia succinea TaxID=84632 RepID=A0ABT9NYB6_9ACTN|nr:hypothetical protein [Kineosporia succinea]MDP9824985.1 hypothetical protein [Kineosporia succinea]